MNGGSDESYFLLAISDDSDPNGDWDKFRINVTNQGGGGDIDSPELAVDDEIVYLSADFFTGGSKYLIVMFDKAPLLEGTLGLRRALLISGTQSHGMPVIYGETPAMYLVEHFESATNTKIRLSAITDQLGTPTLTQTELTVDAYGPPESPPQKGTGSRPLTFDSRFWSCVWRNGSLWATHHINSARVVARWYEIKTNDWPVSGDLPEVVQQGNIDPGDPIRTYFSAISVDEFGNAGIVFARSSPNEFISMSRGLRLADDPLGTFGPAVIVKESSAGHSSGRWGDYAGISVDPVDNRTFWAHHEYAPSGGTNWNTWIASFGAPAPPCDGDVNGDNAIDPLDSGFVQARLGCSVGTGDADCDASDVNADGVVDPLDVGYIQARFGACE